MRCRYSLLTVLVLAGTTLNAHALEVTASRAIDADASMGMRMDVADAMITAVINKMLTCNNKGMAFASNESVPGRDADGCIGASTASACGANKIADPTDSAADADGCVDTYVVPSITTETLASMNFVGGYTNIGGNLWNTPSQSRSLAGFVKKGARDFNITFPTTGFVPAAGCDATVKAITIPDATKNANNIIACNYDSSPTRIKRIVWNYDASGQSLTIYMQYYQPGSFSPTTDTTNLNNIQVTYHLDKLVLGDDE